MIPIANALAPILIIICGVIYHLVSVKVPEPYIDEVFHLRQCQTYCYYNVNEWIDRWDSKITTPPGLYLLGIGYSYVIKLLSFDSSTSLYQVCLNQDVLRSLNLVGGIIILPSSLALLIRFDPKIKQQFWIVNFISMPLLFTYYFLFYTDVWSAILVIISLVLVISKPIGNFSILLSGLVGFASLWFRQTNIVWIAFILSVLIDRNIDQRDANNANNGNGFDRIFKFVKQFFIDWKFSIPYILNFIFFVVFIKLNGGITFGDKENHQINLHIVQVFYCFTFIVFFTWPVWLSKPTIIKYIKFVLLNNWGLNLIMNSGSMILIKYIIDNFTVIHPFLLADNRHYTFYIFKKILSHPKSFLITIPVYHFATWLIINTLNHNTNKVSLSFITILTFIGGIFITIIPSPLFEPRYYIIPLVIFRLFITPPTKGNTRHVVEFIWYQLINVVIFTIFFKYEFKWESEGDIPQRIIW